MLKSKVNQQCNLVSRQEIHRSNRTQQDQGRVTLGLPVNSKEQEVAIRELEEQKVAFQVQAILLLNQMHQGKLIIGLHKPGPNQP